MNLTQRAIRQILFYLWQEPVEVILVHILEAKQVELLVEDHLADIPLSIAGASMLNIALEKYQKWKRLQLDLLADQCPKK